MKLFVAIRGLAQVNLLPYVLSWKYNTEFGFAGTLSAFLAAFKESWYSLERVSILRRLFFVNSNCLIGFFCDITALIEWGKDLWAALLITTRATKYLSLFDAPLASKYTVCARASSSFFGSGSAAWEWAPSSRSDPTNSFLSTIIEFDPLNPCEILALLPMQQE